jgi:hypothetical protein
MYQFRSFRQIVLISALVVGSSASRADCQDWDPLGISNHYHYKPFGEYGPQLNIDTISPTKVMNGGSLGKANRRVARRTSPSRTTRFDELNLSVNMPSGPWVKMDPQQTGSKACFLASRTDPAIVISLAGEAVGVEADDTNDSLLAASQAKMLSLPGAAIAPGARLQSAGHIDGMAFEATVAQGDTTGYYSIWVANYHGYNYKLAVYGDQRDKLAIDQAMHNFLRGLKPIQSNRIARSPNLHQSITR